MRRAARFRLVCASTALAVLAASPVASADRTLSEYRYFRALSVDLVGRAPTLEEIEAFESTGFDLDQWIEQRITDPANAAYLDRLTRVYMDAMRLRVGSSFQFSGRWVLHREQVQIENPTDPSHPQLVNVYYRRGQRRLAPHAGTRPTTVDDADGDFCLLPAESGVAINQSGGQVGTRITIPLTTFNQYVTRVKPWWLYADDRATQPSDRYDPTTWATRFPGFVPNGQLTQEPLQTGQTTPSPTTAVYVCREEAQTTPRGAVMLTGRTTAGTPPYSNGRIIRFPTDPGWARTNSTASVDCTTPLGFATSAECGCGPGLEFCMPGSSGGIDPPSFNIPSAGMQPLGLEEPVDGPTQTQSSWMRLWWGQEARHFFTEVFAGDLDFRTVLTGHFTWVNGPLAQFYRYISPTAMDPTAAQTFGFTEPIDPLFDPTALPPDDPTMPNALRPQETEHWVRVNDRGPHASGILTMPVFLTKYGSRRARAHVLYNAFFCQDFVATGNLQLTASTEPNLMVRQGCRDCHATLEPMAAYFARVMESDWTYIPASLFPTTNDSLCNTTQAIHGACDRYYDRAFLPLGRGAVLRGAYPDLTDPSASPNHVDAGPAGLARDIVSDPRFATCVASNMASSFLGRPLNPVDDQALVEQLAQAFVGDGSSQRGYRVRALVRAIVHSDAYRHGNDLDAASWRAGGGQ